MPYLPSGTHTPKLISLWVACFICAPLIAVAQEQPYPIAGLNPHQRPAQAPVITQTPEKDNDWYKNALHGIEAPYPANLQFLEDQGGWYTPFTRSGMTGPYDIRNWHSK